MQFARPLPADGYAWWYLDALSDDGRHGLTLIAMLGCVFSPYYARARRHGPSEPLEHCAMNMALYGATGRRWAMTERPQRRVQRDADRLTIGPSSMRWQDGHLEIAIDERTAPWPRALRGRIRVQPLALTERVFMLDDAGRHRWRPIAPQARVEASFSDPALDWSGDGYLDSNDGDAPLETDFESWTWSRGLRGDRATVLYDVRRRDGSPLSLALDFDRAGAAFPIDPPPRADLPQTLWRMARSTRSDAGSRPKVISTLEDGPFYARSVVASRVGGMDVTAVHESLSLDRFASRWVQTLLPVRMPRSRR
jgi:carotenoid 1,2-hydratase